MQVEINLLESKEHRNLLPYLLGGLFIVSVIFAVVIITSTYLTMKTELQAIEDDTRLIIEEQAAITEAPADALAVSRQELVDTVQQLEANLYAVPPIMGKLVAILPERGFFERLDILGQGEIQLVAKFDNMQEIAAYTRELEDSLIFHDIQVTSIKKTKDGIGNSHYSTEYLLKFEHTGGRT